MAEFTTSRNDLIVICVVLPNNANRYSDMALLKNGSLGVLFEKDAYNTISFAVIDP